MAAVLLAGCQPPVVEAHFVPPATEREPSPPDASPGGLTVSGTATLQVEPDIADVSLELSARGKTPEAATKTLRAQQTSMRANLQAEGVQDDDVTVSALQLTPQYRWEGTVASTQRQVLTGYVASLRVVVSTEAFEDVPAIVDAGAKAGVTNSSTAFRSTQMVTLKREVRAMALEAAKDKAEQFQTALSIASMHVHSVSEAQGGRAWSAYGFGTDNAVANVQAQALGDPAAPVHAATLPLTLTVTVGYRFD